MKHTFRCLVALLMLSSAAQTHAHTAHDNYHLPLDLAIAAAREAVRSCEASGYRVSVAIVDLSGQVQVQLKGDNSTIHTKDTAFRKAYTLVTLGPVFKLDTSAAIAEMMRDSPNKAAFLTVPGITPLPGAVALKANDKIIAAIGVGGAPGGDKDHACARAGALKIAEQLPG